MKIQHSKLLLMTLFCVISACASNGISKTSKSDSERNVSSFNEEKKSIRWAFIFHAAEANPKKDRYVLDRGGMRTTLVAVSDPNDAIKVAIELAAQGVQFIELCGAFEPGFAGEVTKATGGKVAVGSVGYSGSAIGKMGAIFPDREK